MTKIIFTMIGLLVAAPLAWGISRVGNGSRLQTNEFVVSVPAQFNNVEIMDANSARMVGLPGIISGMSRISATGFGIGDLLTPSFIDLSDFVKEYPEFSLLSAAELQKKLIGNGFEQRVSTNGCMSAYWASTVTAYTVIVWWDTGRGYVLAGQKNNSVYKAMLEIIGSTKLSRNCSWK